MTREDIISMAREQGLPETEVEGVFRVNTDDLGRFAALVEERTHTNSKARWYQEGVEAERNRIDCEAKDIIKRAEARGAAIEREACAQTIESLPGCSQYYPHVPDIIRERSST